MVSLVSIPRNDSSKAAMFPSSSRSAQISSEEGEWSYTGCINISTPRLVDIHQVHLGEVCFLAYQYPLKECFYILHVAMSSSAKCCQNMPNAPKSSQMHKSAFEVLRDLLHLSVCSLPFISLLLDRSGQPRNVEPFLSNQGGFSWHSVSVQVHTLRPQQPQICWIVKFEFEWIVMSNNDMKLWMPDWCV